VPLAQPPAQADFRKSALVSPGSELVVAEIDLDACLPGKERTFNFGKHRRPEAYGRLLAQKGVIEPEEPKVDSC
jgi:hypothetical protein